MNEDRRLFIYWLCLTTFSFLTTIFILMWILLGDKYKIPTLSMIVLMVYSLYNTIYDEVEKVWPFVGLIITTILINLYLFFK